MEKDDFFEEYLKRQEALDEEELTENNELINEFMDFCATKDINLTREHFKFVEKIGIVAIYPNIVQLLNENIVVDKEGLLDVDLLSKEFDIRPFAPGYIYSDKFIGLAHPYFRRSYHDENNFAPRFIEFFWRHNIKDNKKYIAIDPDRVRVNVDESTCMELDTWFGANFKHDVRSIENGIVRLRPPLDISEHHINTFFGNTYALDIKWSSKKGIRIFQSEEFKFESSKILKDGKEYFPVKYVHAEFDIENGYFRHFDGAIHFYNEEEYYLRRESDFNYNDKNFFKLKTLSQKLFKINGKVSVEEWVNLTSHFLTGNPLVFEYFEGKIPDSLNEILDILRKKQNDG